VKSVFLTLSALAVVAACAPSIPDSGVGFEDYEAYEQERFDRDRELTGQVAPQSGVISGEVPSVSILGDPNPQAASPNDPLTAGNASDPISLLPDDAEAVTTTTTAASAPASNAEAVGALGISRENDFDAVSNLRDIEDDAARSQAQAAQYQQVAPTAVPERDGSRPNIVQYALSAPNNVGEPRFKRRGFNLAEQMLRACARYPSSDIAQEDFLANGGPERDRLKVDPDGDGFACAWDPAPFRRAVSGGRTDTSVEVTPLGQ